MTALKDHPVSVHSDMLGLTAKMVSYVSRNQNGTTWHCSHMMWPTCPIFTEQW